MIVNDELIIMYILLYLDAPVDVNTIDFSPFGHPCFLVSNIYNLRKQYELANQLFFIVIPPPTSTPTTCKQSLGDKGITLSFC